MTLAQSEPKKIYIWVPRLPSAYQEVEYIASSWTQYINSWYIPTSTTRLQLQTATDWVSWLTWVFGSRHIAWSTAYSLINYAEISYNWSSNVIRVDVWNNQRWVWTWTAWTPYTLDINVPTWKVLLNDVEVLTGQTFTPHSSQPNIYIFSSNCTMYWQVYYSGKIYYFNIYNNWNLVREFVPCYRKSDSVIWLYDLVNDQFYTNAGTGTFTKWADV